MVPAAAGGGGAIGGMSHVPKVAFACTYMRKPVKLTGELGTPVIVMLFFFSCRTISAIDCCIYLQNKLILLRQCQWNAKAM